MDFIIFYKWLQSDQNLKERSAKDVVSRCRRVSKMIKSDCLEDNSMELLIENDSYENCSMYVKSQLKRALALYMEFQKGKVIE